MIDEETAARVAALARIQLPPDRQGQVARELDAIAEAMDRLRDLPLDEVPPLDLPPVGRLALREDAPAPSLPREAALANAPDQEDGRFRVPRVIEDA